MKRFRFRLQKLLDIREAQEKKIKNELAALVSLQNIERNKQNELRQKISERKQTLRIRMKDNICSYNEVMMFEKFTDTANKAINISEQKIREMEPEILNVRQRLMNASKEKKVVEKLKERKYNDYLYAVNRETTKENDDINQKIFQKKLEDSMYQ